MTADPKSLPNRLRVEALFHDSGHDETDSSRLMREAATALDAQAALLEEARGLLARLAEVADDVGMDENIGTMDKAINAARAYLAKTEPT